MSKSLRIIALLAVSTAVILAGKQAVQAQAPIWAPPEPEFVQGPRLGFIGYFNGSGERVLRVIPGSLAWRIGLEPRDVIVGVNGVRIRYEGHWHALLANAAYRGHAVLVVRDWRSGRLVRRYVDLSVFGMGMSMDTGPILMAPGMRGAGMYGE